MVFERLNESNVDEYAEKTLEIENCREEIMPSSKEYVNYILGQLSGLDEIAVKPMMGEYLIYYRGKLVGGIYDDRLLVKPVQSAIEYMPQASYSLPYEGAKEMLLVDNVDDKDYLSGLLDAMYDDLPVPKTR